MSAVARQVFASVTWFSLSEVLGLTGRSHRENHTFMKYSFLHVVIKCQKLYDRTRTSAGRRPASATTPSSSRFFLASAPRGCRRVDEDAPPPPPAGAGAWGGPVLSQATSVLLFSPHRLAPDAPPPSPSQAVVHPSWCRGRHGWDVPAAATTMFYFCSEWCVFAVFSLLSG